MALWTRAITLAIGAMLSMATFAESTITERFEGVDSVDLNMGSGNAIITQGAANEVTVTIRHDYDDDVYRPVLRQSGSRVELREKFKFRGNWHRGRNAVWEITVPDEVDLDADLGSGNLSIEGVSMTLKADLGSGDTTIEAVDGKLRISGGSGDLELSHVTGEVSFRGGSGDVEIEQLNGELRSNTGSGNTRITESTGEFKIGGGSGDMRLSDVAGGFDVSNGSGDITGGNVRISAASRFGTGSGEVTMRDMHIEQEARFSTGSGDAEVALGEALGADISISSGSGDASLDFGGHKMTGDVVMRASKRNGRIRAPFKFDREYLEDEGWDTVMVKEVTLTDEGPHIRVSTGSGTAEIEK